MCLFQSIMFPTTCMTSQSDYLFYFFFLDKTSNLWFLFHGGMGKKHQFYGISTSISEFAGEVCGWGLGGGLCWCPLLTQPSRIRCELTAAAFPDSPLSPLWPRRVRKYAVTRGCEASAHWKVMAHNSFNNGNSLLRHLVLLHLHHL